MSDTTGWSKSTRRKSKAKSIDTLTSFVRDTEHELFSIITSLQAQLDVLQCEQLRNNLPVDRFEVLNRSVAQIVSDTTALASISEMAKTRRSLAKVSMPKLIGEILEETRLSFARSQISLAYNIDADTTLAGNVDAIKLMFKALLLVALKNAQKHDTINVVGLAGKRKTTFSFDIGVVPAGAVFKPWRLGELRLFSTNSQGIELSAVDAIARMHEGQLSVGTVVDKQVGYKLIFRV